MTTNVPELVGANEFETDPEDDDVLDFLAAVLSRFLEDIVARWKLVGFVLLAFALLYFR